MNIHIGGTTSIDTASVISMHDFAQFINGNAVENEFVQLINSGSDDLLNENDKGNKFVFLAPLEKIKSIVVTDDFVYLSIISVNTLRKRAGNIF